MRHQKPNDPVNQRREERGAALITTLLLSALLLAAGGTLILTTAMTGTTAVESTAEMQAYYAAEAGVASALNVLRGNVDSNPTGTRATFREIACSKDLWTATSGNYVNLAANGSTSFRVTSIVDPDDPAFLFCTDIAKASYKPSRLVVQVAGFGPRNSRKNMEIVINRLTVNYAVNSVITLPNESGSAINFLLGDSNATEYLGDNGPASSCGTPSSIAAFAVSTDHLGNSDFNTTSGVINGGNPTVTPPVPMLLDSNNSPSFLKDVPSARTFLDGPDGMKALAMKQGRYFTSGAAAIASSAGLGASNPDGVLTFVDGDFTLGPGSPTGQGTLIVTGTLDLNGTFGWNGVIMVLGTGRVTRSGGGHGTIMGAMFVANFARTGLPSDIFSSPTFDTSGGGTATIQYCQEAIDKAKSVGGHSVVGVREF